MLSCIVDRVLADLQYRGQGYRDGREFDTYGIVYVTDPYEPREGT